MKIINMLPTINKECSDFLNKSNNLLLLKSLPKDKEGFRKVKVRQRNIKEIFQNIFDKGLYNSKSITPRSVQAIGENGYSDPQNDNLEPFYIFPINGFKYFYNPIVKNSQEQYSKLINKSLNIIDRDTIIDMFSESIKESYVSDNLYNGIAQGAEIIIYNIPYFYAIRKTVFDDLKQD